MMYSKFPALKSVTNKLSLHQIPNKRELNQKNKLEKQIQNFTDGLDMYNNLKYELDEARHTQEANKKKYMRFKNFRFIN